MKNKKGLTLIELLAVIAIIAILFVLLIPQINNAINKARETGVTTDFRSYQNSIFSYFQENGHIKWNSLNHYLGNELSFSSVYSKKEKPVW